jgi:hypothetical protein
MLAKAGEDAAAKAFKTTMTMHTKPIISTILLEGTEDPRMSLVKDKAPN